MAQLGGAGAGFVLQRGGKFIFSGAWMCSPF